MTLKPKGKSLIHDVDELRKLLYSKYPHLQSIATMKEQYAIFRKDYERYASGDQSMPFSELRLSLDCLIEVLDKELK